MTGPKPRRAYKRPRPSRLWILVALLYGILAVAVVIILAWLGVIG
jgi:flagellar basal body-associated protein FliL